MRRLTNGFEAVFGNESTETAFGNTTGEETNVSGPSPEDFRAKVFRDREHVGNWRVEKLCKDGESIEVAIFSGGDAQLRAIRYADREYGEFDEIELAPYSGRPSG